MEKTAESRDNSDFFHEAANLLTLDVGVPIQASVAGMFVSRGFGRHPNRKLGSYELIFVRAGVLEIWEEDQQFRVGPGECLLLWPGRRHGGAADYLPDLSFYWMHFTLERQGKESDIAIVSLPQQVRVARPDSLTALFRRFLEDQESRELIPAMADLIVAQMLLEVSISASRETPPAIPAEALVGRAAEMIETRFHEPLSTTEIANRLGSNADYLGRMFRRVYGMGIVEAVHRRRLRHSKRLLMEEALNVEEIARMCGFRDPGYFRRLFKRHEGMTPLAYQHLHARINVNTE
ncbi:MAG: AraC family transcriptional regulator [Verrucomicrobiaceae bacterium]|nr:MAG: AraC family transcriptional regulator [Verrucomicrobiaceae bacterium]